MLQPTLRLRSMRVLVTGASGFIGSALVHGLVAKGAEVTAVARSLGRLEEHARDYRFIFCDLRSLPQTRAAVVQSRPQIVFHLAGQPDGPEEVDRLHTLIEHNICAVGNLLRSIVDLPSVAMVYGDSAKVYGNAPVPHRSDHRLDPLSTYAVSKQAGWALVDVFRRVHGLQAVGLRPTLVYGPSQGYNLFTFLITSILSRQEEILLDGGTQSRDPLYIDDAVNAFLATAEHLPSINGMNLPVGGNREMTVADIARLTVHLLGGRQKVVVRPCSVRPTEMSRSWCDNAEARSLLGWSPQMPLEEGVLRTARALHPAHAFSTVPMQQEAL